MFRLFKKRQEPSAAGKMWLKVGQRIESRQRQLADKLNSRAAGWSRKSVVIGLIVFSVLYSGLLVLNLSIGTGSSSKMDHVSVPEHALLPEQANTTDGNPILSPEAFNRLLSFRQYLDSLKQSPDGLQQYEQIIKDHPGIRDSVEYIISLYESQSKNVEYGKEK